jgi:hypothetical protein
MEPNTQTGFNPDNNPFAGIIKGGQAPQSPAPQGQQMMPDPMDPSQPGQTGDSSKPLIMAIKSLHDYIAMSTDVRTQNMVRNLITMLTQLLSKDQQAGMKKGEAVAPKGEMPAMPMM